MLKKVSDLTGAELDYAVAMVEGEDYSPNITYNGIGLEYPATEYSTNWAQGGPIIEREKITLSYGLGIRSNLWFAEKYQCYAAGRNTTSQQYGPTPLIAAMRCYVASKLGDTVEIPDEIGAEK